MWKWNADNYLKCTDVIAHCIKIMDGFWELDFTYMKAGLGTAPREIRVTMFKYALISITGIL